ncbi:hypothetical protein GCM10010413_41170 [Promicromonospora sukumoe]|uniref:Uncharacterized protein n=1 Tax=Promicromonospora sukumoe TaxID=88382 RepID=A0A7W3JE64_9MICO|nr:hypothetical protein [Promicromonospora sukumoe]MBA8811175.1 hypothetical protein [Promicromonospora sukumoe]
MLKRQITKKDHPDLLAEMGKDLETSRVMVGRMDQWATEIGLDDVSEALYAAFIALKDAQETADRASRTLADEIEKEGRDR